MPHVSGIVVEVVLVLGGVSVVDVVVVGCASVVVVVGSLHVQLAEHVEPGGHRKTPPGELGSHGSS